MKALFSHGEAVVWQVSDIGFNALQGFPWIASIGCNYDITRYFQIVSFESAQTSRHYGDKNVSQAAGNKGSKTFTPFAAFTKQNGQKLQGRPGRLFILGVKTGNGKLNRILIKCGNLETFSDIAY